MSFLDVAKLFFQCSIVFMFNFLDCFYFTLRFSRVFCVLVLFYLILFKEV